MTRARCPQMQYNRERMGDPHSPATARSRRPLLQACILAPVAVGSALVLAASSAPAQDVFGGPDPSSHRSGLAWNRAAQTYEDSGADRPAMSPHHGEQRPFVFMMDPSIAAPGEVGLEYSLQAASGTDALRPLPANLGAEGAIQGASVIVGVTKWLALQATGLVYQPAAGAQAQTSATGQAAARVLLTRPDASFRAGVTTLFLRELGGSSGVASRLSASYDVGLLRIAGNAHAEKIFAGGRDSVDLLAFGGASIRATHQLRLGAEYVGQDLEDAFEPGEAEGGARHFAGPVAAVTLLNDAFWITAGPALGLNERSPRLIGRLTMLATF